MSWPTARLEDLVDFNPAIRLTNGQQYPFVPMDAIQPGDRFVKAKQRRLAGGGAKFQNQDVLFARITPCLENGKIAQYRSANLCPAFGSTEFIVLRAKPEKLDQDFLYYLVLTECVRGPAEKSMSGATGRQRADINAIRKIEIPLPPLATQRRIAGILSAYDDLIENNARRIAILEEMARRLFEDWFIHFRYPGGAGPDAGLPDEWEEAELNDWVTELRDAIDPNAIDPETAYIGLEHLPRRSTTMNDWGQAGSVGSTKLRFQRGDILFGKIRPYFHKVALAPMSGVASSDAIVIRPRSVAHLPAALAVASSDNFVAHATQTSNGTKMPRADWKVLKHYPLPRPPAELLAKFNAALEPSLWLCAKLAEQNTTLRATRDMLLPKLISGEIDVSGVEAVMEKAA